MAGDEMLRVLSADLSIAGNLVQERARRVVRKTAMDIKSTAQQLAPVDTGNLKSSITMNGPLAGQANVAEVGPTANYGLFVEAGTTRSGPQPFMGPAADRHAPSFEAAMEQLGREALGG